VSGCGHNNARKIQGGKKIEKTSTGKKTANYFKGRRTQKKTGLSCCWTRAGIQLAPERLFTNRSLNRGEKNLRGGSCVLASEGSGWARREGTSATGQSDKATGSRSRYILEIMKNTQAKEI